MGFPRGDDETRTSATGRKNTIKSLCNGNWEDFLKLHESTFWKAYKEERVPDSTAEDFTGEDSTV